MGTTANRAYPYPESTDDVRPYEDLEFLADAVDADVEDIVNKPLGRIVQGTAQALPDNTSTAITFAAADEIDTHGDHNPASNNSRVTPTTPGYYRFTGTTFFETQLSSVLSQIHLRKNGSTGIPPGSRFVPASSNAFSLSCTAIVACNGSTDYVEMMAQQDSGGADSTNVSLQLTSVLEWEWLRPL